MNIANDRTIAISIHTLTRRVTRCKPPRFYDAYLISIHTLTRRVTMGTLRAN